MRRVCGSLFYKFNQLEFAFIQNKLKLFRLHYLQFGYANVSLGCVTCDCNASGSIEKFCDTHSGQCPCKMGIEGLHCDECVEGFYGLSIDGCQGNLKPFVVCRMPLQSNARVG